MLSSLLRGAGWFLVLALFFSLGRDQAVLRFEQDCILQAVTIHMGVSLRGTVAPPAVSLSSATPPAAFQKAAQAEWDVMTDRLTNAYFAGRNWIFLIDTHSLYQQGRTLDDSLAHEYAHFLQVRYRAVNPAHNDRNEREAIAVEHWFRATFMSPFAPPHPCGLRPEHSRR